MSDSLAVLNSGDFLHSLLRLQLCAVSLLPCADYQQPPLGETKQDKCEADFLFPQGLQSPPPQEAIALLYLLCIFRLFYKLLSHG